MNHANSTTRVVVAMSGGVDSSVAAYLLAQKGYDVLGVTMRLWSDDDPDTAGHRGCCSLDDIEDARRAAAAIGIPHYVLDVRREFRAHVMDYFIAEYRKGRTPHPCIACNDRIKFDFLLRRAEALGAAFVATGHYARIACAPTAPTGCCAASMRPRTSRTSSSAWRRSSCVASSSPSASTARRRSGTSRQKRACTSRTRRTARRFASSRRATTASSCARRSCRSPGELVDTRGRVLGEHPGIEFFTIGQRRGIGVATGERLFVTRIDPESRRVVLGGEDDLLAQSVGVGAVRYASGNPPHGPVRVHAKVRYSTPPLPGTLEPDEDGAVFRFDAPQRAITPGQAAVFYDGDEVIGGGYIEGARD